MAMAMTRAGWLLRMVRKNMTMCNRILVYTPSLGSNYACHHAIYASLARLIIDNDLYLDLDYLDLWRSDLDL